MTTGLEKWDIAFGERVPEDFLQREVLGAPGFAAAHRAAIEGALEYSQGHAAFQSTVSDIGQFFLCSLALYLDASGGLSHRRLRDLIGGTGLISEGRASAVLWRLRLGKFVEPDDVGEGKLKRFVPTRAMEEAFRERVRVDIAALVSLDPAAAALLARLDEPEVFKPFIRQMGDDMIASAGKPDPRLEAFYKVAARTMGVLIIYELVRTTPDDGSYPPRGLSAASVAGLARRFKVSRSHVLSLLRQMETLGFLAFDPKTGRPVLREALSEALRVFQALVFTGQLRAAHRALAGLQAPRD